MRMPMQTGRFLGTIVVAIVTDRAAAPLSSPLTPLSVSPVCCQGNVSSSQQHLDRPLFQFSVFFFFINLQPDNNYESLLLEPQQQRKDNPAFTLFST